MNKSAMSDHIDTYRSELLVVEGFLGEIQELIKDLAVVVEINRLCKNEHGRLTTFGDSVLTEGINRGTPGETLARMIGISKQAIWARRSNTVTHNIENGIYKETELAENLSTLRTASLLKYVSALSKSLLRLRLSLKKPDGSRLSKFGKDFLSISIKNGVEPELIAKVLDVSPSYVALFKQRTRMKDL